MQNKIFVKVFAALLTLVCIFYLSFSFVTSHYEEKIAEMEATDSLNAAAYRDSLMSEKTNVWLGYNLKRCQEMQISLGLDLKGGMTVVLEVDVPEVVRALADHKERTDADFANAVNEAAKEAKTSNDDFITIFIRKYDHNLSTAFATQQLRGKVNYDSDDAEVEKVLREAVADAVDNAYLVLRTRIDRFGVAQPNIQKIEGNKMGRILVEMPGIRDVERVSKLLEGSANLEFWTTYTETEVYPYLNQLNTALAQANAQADAAEETEAEVAEEETEVAEVAVKDTLDKQAELAAAMENGNGSAEDNDKNLDAYRRANPLFGYMRLIPQGDGCVVAYVAQADTAAVNHALRSEAAREVLPSDLKLLWGVKPASEGGMNGMFELYAIRISERNGRAPLEGEVVVDAKEEFDQHGRPCVSMSMNSEGARRWAALTKANVKRCVAIVLDGYVYSAPTVQNEITGGNSQITGNFTTQDTKDLVNVLKSGKMPAPTYIASREVVGPSLGAESIQIGAISFAIAFIILMLYMIAMYGLWPGMVANTALLLNAFFTLGVLTSFQAALTMSGIAGLVLSLGMAVDANVLIYERTKEELRAGKKIQQALADGYGNAFSAIFDSNLTSIITGIILFNFGTGPVRGFATTLIVGICVSFFTAVFLTRIVYEWQMNKGKWQGLTFTTSLAKKFSFNDQKLRNFMGAYKKSFAVFGTFVVIGVIMMFTRGFSKSIDFTGGRNFTVKFEQPVTTSQINDLVSATFVSEDGSSVNNQVIAIGADGQTVRISTNYLIEQDGAEVDETIERMLYDTFTSEGLVTSTFEMFTNHDVRDGGSIISSQKVGPSMADDITRGAIWSVVFALVAIFLYILFRFRNLSFSVGAITALAIDTLIILGAYATLWGFMPFSLEIDQTFIGAVLTAIGYSINDKVVVFDRIREYLHLYPKRDKQLLFNQSLTSTLNRTVNTSVSTAIVLLVILSAIFFGGSSSIASFAFAMILGVVVGTFSSMFIAAPVAFLLHRKNKSIVTEE